ncbi:hypothetical protein [Campylobacter pinnipediorum]|uniref:hypothetical protein n=1 Tax=Campylobacter pinnipediorum TaxID=1965231 RepID=UPI00084DE976|nr:hypothetical protein [Campylobacter pinnipediorum]
MKVQNNILNISDNKSPIKSSKENFNHILNNIKPEIQANSDKNFTKMSVDDFRKSLVKYGASGFMIKMQTDWIDAKIEEKRAELELNLGLHDNSKTDKEKSEIAQIIENILKDYKQELIKKIKQKIEQEKIQSESQIQKNSLTMLLKKIQNT